MNFIPYDVMINILNRLTIEEIQILSIVNDEWHEAAGDDYFFRNKFMTNKPWDIDIWKVAFANYPCLNGNFEDNYEIVKQIIGPERYIQSCLDQLPNDNFISPIVRTMRQFETPTLTHSDFVTFIYRLAEQTPKSVDFATFILHAAELHDWPNCFDQSVKIDRYWMAIVVQLSRCVPSRISRKFLHLYRHNVYWKYVQIYKHLTDEWIDCNEDIWHLLDWSAILTTVNLTLRILTLIMKAVWRYQIIGNHSHRTHAWYGSTPNIAYIASHQILTEDFIEKWFVNTPFDKDYIWANIFSKQNLGADFRSKYEHKKPKPITYHLQHLLNDN